MQYHLISADSHINEPPETYVSRVPQHLRAKAPHVIPTADGAEGWQWEEGPVRPITETNSAVFVRGKVRSPGDYVRSTCRFADLAKGSWDPAAHVADMRIDGVDASVIYYSVIGSQLYEMADPELRVACIRAYNDWLAEFCAVDPARLVGVALLPTEEDSIEPALAELERARKAGYRSVMVPMFPKRRYYDRFYDRLWAALQESDVSVSIHRAGLKAGTPGGSSEGPWIENQVLRDFGYAIPVGDFLFGVVPRFPRLKVVSGEGRIGWLAYFAQRADESYRRHRHLQGIELPALPSEMMKSNLYSTFIEDKMGILLRDVIGVDNQMWSSDYPHSDSSWPYSKKVNAEQFVGVPEGEKSKILAGNAARLYGLA